MKRLLLVVFAAALLSACASGIYQPVNSPASSATGPARTQANPASPGTPGAANVPGAPGPILPGSNGSGGQPDIGVTPTTRPGGAIARLPEPPQPSPAAGAAASLLVQSQRERSTGEFDRAAATLERALALAPDEPSLWVELAEVRLEQGNAALAQETARKALTLTGDDRQLETRARRLISR